MKKLISLLLFATTVIFQTQCFAMPNGIDTELFKPGAALEVNGTLAEQLSPVIGIVQLVGAGVAVVASIMMGIRYVMSSVEEKAEVKKKIFAYATGALIFFGATGILQLILYVSTWFII